MFVSNAQVTVEIGLDLTGYIDPAEPMTRDYPGCDALVPGLLLRLLPLPPGCGCPPRPRDHARLRSSPCSPGTAAAQAW